ncbi:MAG: DUF2341 domain-containing protein [Candidatus Paceibacterota bacterium]
MFQKKVYPMKCIPFNRAFTLIELLVTIAIVGLLSGFIFVSMLNAINSGNDARRKSDLAAIEKALLAYQAEGNTLPASCNTLTAGCLSEISAYLPSVPDDPDLSKSYVYTKVGSDFTLSGTLSNGNTYSYASGGWSEVTNAFLANYHYRKSHLIAGSSAGAQTNYQVKFIVHRGTGTDSGQDVYMDTAKLDSTYKDLRFTSSDKTTLLDYWIETSDSSSATVWVEIPTIPASTDNPSTATIYIYYGNSSAVAIDRDTGGDATFSFFDDFNAASLNASKWDASGTGTTTITGSVITLAYGSGGANYKILGKSSYGTGYNTATLFKIKTLHGLNSVAHDEFFGIDPGNYYSVAAIPSYSVAYRRGKWESYDTAQALTNMSVWAANTFYKVEMIRNGTTNVMYKINDTLDATITTNLPGNTSRTPGFGDYVAGGSVSCDWVLIRKYISPEPTHSTYAAEESN